MFRRDSKVDAFQRQISALRQQLGGDHDDFDSPLSAVVASPHDDFTVGLDVPRLESARSSALTIPREPDESRNITARVASSDLPAVPAIDELTSILSHTTTWAGNLDSTGSLHIHGRVEGSLTARDDIFVAEEADVDAVIRATNVTIAGNVRGSIHCAGRFEVLPRGRVAGDVRAPIVVIHDGAVVAGNIAMTSANDAAAAPRIGARAARGG